ncbi:hypothetical protein Hdeb2414_s0366g00878001 [Helianthus debilis subsp. tardiflorus]
MLLVLELQPPSLARVRARLIVPRLLLRPEHLIYLLHALTRREKRKEDDVEVEQVREDVVAGAGAGGGEARAEGVETEVESSEATPHATNLTKCGQGTRGGGVSRTRQSPEFQHVQGGSWTTHNPTCDDLPHAPH